jgi:hypothetical protein
MIASILRISALVMALTALLGLSGCSGGAEDAAEKLVADQMRDPASAQFREVKVVKQQDGSEAVCGEVNGKNAFGGYVGFRGFVVHGSEVHIRNDDLNMSDIAEIEASTRAIEASTKYCILAGRTMEEIDASTTKLREQIDATGS